MVSQSTRPLLSPDRLAVIRRWRLRAFVLTISRTLIYVLSIVATACTVAASSAPEELADALHGATWVLLMGAIFSALLMLATDYVSTRAGLTEPTDSELSGDD